MNKLLSPRSRAGFGAFLSFIAILFIVAFVTGELKHPTLQFSLDVVAVVLLVGSSHYFIHVQPEIEDLIEEASRRLDSDKLAAMEWAAMEIRQAKVSELTIGQKLMTGFVVLSGTVFCLFGIADIAGYIRPMRIPGANGVITTVPHWLSGLVIFGIGILAFLFTSIIRIQIVDRIDEAAKKLFREMDGKGWKPH